MKIKIEITESPEKIPNIIFLMDKSGSMQSIKNDTIGGFNSFVDKQKGQGGAAHLNVILFDTVTSTYYKGDVSAVPNMTTLSYSPDGMTALYDAIGKSLKEYAHYKKALVVILTDGAENSSSKYDRDRILSMIREKENNGWQFLYLGANQDAFTESAHIGISRDCTRSFDATPIGINAVFGDISVITSSYRNGSLTTNTIEGSI